MRRLPLMIIPLLIVMKLVSQGFNSTDSPHGKRLKISCSECHTSDGWILDANNTFDHGTTDFQLVGQHVFANCKACHPTLVFDEAGNNCVDCHTDMHQESLGMNCERCHTEESWLVSNIFEIHQMGRFPLLGAHSIADCQDCHLTESLLRFEPLGIECYDCHKQNYLATTFPDHQAAGYSLSCEECHHLNTFEWSATGINHDFFPLLEGHAIDDCASCHNVNDYKAISAECYACHQGDYTAASNPNHPSAGFDTDCASCHTLTPGWAPAHFDHSVFFLLSGAHDIKDCASCHNVNNYSAASSECFSCHESDYNKTGNPNHAAAGFSTDCASCHSTSGEWIPASFDHDPFFPLTGVHDINDCTKCHIGGNYTNASSDCFSCHEADFNSTRDPNHVSAGFSTDCQLCHSTVSGWKPSTFDHDSYFPIYSGKHRGEWNTCADCHTNSSNYAVFSCTDCHEHSKSRTDDHHDEVRDYVYVSSACFNCHPQGREND